MTSFLKSPKKLIVLISLILSLLAVITFNNPVQALVRLVIVLIIAALSDYSLGVYRKIESHFPDSALTIACSLFLLADPSSPIFQLFLAIIISLAAKHYLMVKGRNLFNPAALGLLTASFFGLKITWWGFLPGIIFSTLLILLTGFVSVYLLRQGKIIFAFMLTIFGLTFFFTLNPLFTLTQFLVGGFWFFTLVMLPDPAIAPKFTKTKIAYGVFVGLLSLTLPKIGIGTDPLLTSLLIGNLVFWFMDRKSEEKLEKLADKLPLASKLVSPE